MDSIKTRIEILVGRRAELQREIEALQQRLNEAAGTPNWNETADADGAETLIGGNHE